MLGNVKEKAVIKDNEVGENVEKCGGQEEIMKENDSEGNFRSLI